MRANPPKKTMSKINPIVRPNVVKKFLKKYGQS